MNTRSQSIGSYGPRVMVAADLYGDRPVPVGEFRFKPSLNCFPDGGPTLHGKTGAEMSRIVNPEHPEKWRDDSNSIHIDLDGPFGTVTGYVDASIFVAVCKALGVQS